jgi:hypothetical protein
MNHSIHSNFARAGHRASHTSPLLGSVHQLQTTHDRSRISAGGWPSLSFAEPEIDPLWDTGVLDRLSSPLTRYHE